MSEIKTSCPICNQHITLDGTWFGREVTCPTCQNRFTVPSPAPPFIKFTAPPPLPVSPSNPLARKNSMLVWIAVAVAALLFLLFIGVTAAGLLAVRNIKTQKQRQAQMLPPETRRPRSSLELRSPGVANVNVEGMLCGTPVRMTTGNMNSHAITLSEGTTREPRQILLFLFLKGASPEDRSWNLPGPSNQQLPRPHVHFRCPSSAGGSGVLPQTYEMHLVFAKENNGRIRATIELIEPGKGISLKGSFELVKENSL